MLHKIMKFTKSILPYALYVAILWSIPTYVFIVTDINGVSMSPTLQSGQSFVVDKLTPKFTGYHHGDVILANLSDQHALKNMYVVKRVIGLPGDTIQIIGNDIYINGDVYQDKVTVDVGYSGLAAEPYRLGDSEYFLMGDNRSDSLDSRDERLGPVYQQELVGRLAFENFLKIRY